MNALVNNGLKMMACGAAAAVITLVMSMSFVHSTAVVHGQSHAPAQWMAKLSVEPAHAWFGQPQPAVLVD